MSVSPALIHLQLLSDTQVRSTLHAQLVYSLPTTLSSLCAIFSTRPVGNACDPGSCHNFHTVQTWIASWNTHTEVRRLSCVARGWSRIETPYEVLQHRLWEIAPGSRQGSNGKRRCATKSLHCQCNLCRSFVNHPSQCGSIFALVTSMNCVTKTWTAKVKISGLHPIMQKSVRLNVVQRVLFFP